MVKVKASQGCRCSQPRPDLSIAKNKRESSHKEVRTWVYATAAESSCVVEVNSKHGKISVAASAVAESSSMMETFACRHGSSVSKRKIESSGKKIVVDLKHKSCSTGTKSKMKCKATSSSSKSKATSSSSKSKATSSSSKSKATLASSKMRTTTVKSSQENIFRLPLFDEYVDLEEW